MSLHAESMYEISLTEGLGPVKFGMSPGIVKSLLGSELCYEDWMGGNLENFLYYKGLLIGFCGEIDDHPTDSSLVCMFLVKTSHPLSLWGQKISNAKMEDIESLLKVKAIKCNLLQSGVLQCVDQELQFLFDSDGHLDEVYFAFKYS
ncbi:hypothetical protein BJL95_04140 [Methylomonas sp. LWB]|nr:hypothetical protein BJL95_04140 [Methylomonas sp. LWB]